MFPSVRSFRHWLLAFFGALAGSWIQAAPVQLAPLPSGTGPETRPPEVVDKTEAPENGWGVSPAQPQARYFRCDPSVEAGRVRLWLAFRGLRQSNYFREFLISTTTDPQPSPQSSWERLFPVGWDSDAGWLERAYPRMRILGTIDKATVRVDGLLSQERVTGIRVEFSQAPDKAKEVELGEARMERMPTGTTNIALGCPVTASHELGPSQCAEFLTDGLVGSYARPGAKDLGAAFYFDIDLRRIRELDHITIRGRSEAPGTNRATGLHFKLFEENPTIESRPVWSGQEREAGRVEDVATAKVVRGSDGEGTFRGRYLRVFSSSTANYSPQIAEVEVYESIVASGVAVAANDRVLPSDARVRIPAEAKWLSFSPTQPGLPDGKLLGRRWRIVGASDEWQLANSTSLLECRALPVGEYLFELQLRHSDLEWNSVSMRVPLVVLTPWWKNPGVQIALAFALCAVATLLAWQISRRRFARRLAELERRQELSRERARIARDMHDVVGARLTQLAMMQEIFGVEHPQSAAAGAQLQQLAGTAREAVAALDEAVWAVNPRNDTLQNVANYLGHAASEYLTPLKITCRQEMPREWPEIEVLSQKRHALLLAFKEALQNIAKHAAATEVTLKARHESGRFIVSIEDNGRGLPLQLDGVEKDGVGNMATRLVDVGGECAVCARPGGGTMVRMEIPV